MAPTDPNDVFRGWARLSFHYGLTLTEIVRLPRAVSRAFHEELDVLLAEQEMAMMEATSVSNMEKSPQKQYLADLERRLNRGRAPSRPQAEPIRDEERYKSAAKGMGIGVKLVPMPGKKKAAESGSKVGS